MKRFSKEYEKERIAKVSHFTLKLAINNIITT